MAYRLLYIADPLDKLNPSHDTTIALMYGDAQRGHEVWFAQQEWLEIVGWKPTLWVKRVEVLGLDQTPWFRFSDEARRPLSDFHRIQFRTDPPVNEAYITTTRILDFIEENRTWVINRPSSLRDYNEKLTALRFPKWTPPTLIASGKEAITQFIKQEGGKAIIKPLGDFGGAGVFLLRLDDPNLNSIIETSTHQGAKPVVLQRYLPEIADGDRRIFLLDGQPLGVLVRLPKDGDVRANMAAGGLTEGGRLTDRERDMLEDVGPFLRKAGIVLCGLDVIGGWMTEINVTSPTGLQEINRYDRKRLELEITDSLDRLSQERLG